MAHGEFRMRNSKPARYFGGIESPQPLLRLADLALMDAKVMHDSVVPAKMETK
jgi:hypothetical protein